MSLLCYQSAPSTFAPGAPLVCARVSGQDRACAEQAQLREILVWAVAAAFAVDVGEIKARTRRHARAAFARQAAMYLAHVGFGLSYSEVGRLFGRDRTTAAYACRRVEDRRDDPLIDAVLGSFEAACYRLCERARRPDRGRS
jgi:Bacterial dnaA protein helix-turn-helix